MGDSDMAVGEEGRKGWSGTGKQAAGRDCAGRCEGSVQAAWERAPGHDLQSALLYVSGAGGWCCEGGGDGDINGEDLGR